MEKIFFALITTRPIEDLFGWVMYNNRAHDDGLMSRNPPISSTPQSLTVASPDVGPMNTPMSTAYASKMIGGSDRIPSLSWSAPADMQSKIKEWVVLSEDPDAPTPEPIVHGLYYGLAASKTSVTQDDFKLIGETEDRKLAGGFGYGMSRTGAVYICPRPIARHGVHRYFFTVLALSQNVNWEEVRRAAAEEVKKDGKKAPVNVIGKREILKAVEGKVLGWGEWVGSYERK